MSALHLKADAGQANSGKLLVGIIARRILSILTEFGCATSCFAETSPQFSFNSASRSLENSLKREAIQSHIWIESPRQDRHKVKTGADNNPTAPLKALSFGG